MRAGNDPDHEARDDENLDRKAHPARGFVGRSRQVCWRRSEENVTDESQRVGDAEHAGQSDDIGQRVVEHRAIVGFDGLGEEHLLGQEPVQQGNAGHGRSCDHGKNRCHRHETPQPAQAADVARSGFVIDDPRRHEQ